MHECRQIGSFASGRRIPRQHAPESRLADVAGEPRKRFTSFLWIRFERLPLAGNRRLLEYLSAAGVKTMHRQGRPCSARTVRMARKQRVDCKGGQRPPKMFSKSRFVPAG